MITEIHGLPENMVGFRAEGEIIKEDFDPVIDRVSQFVDKTGKLNYLLFLDTSPSDFTMGAWLNDALLGIRNIAKWNRAAIVTDSESVIKFTDAFSKIMPGEFRGYSKDEYDAAIKWTSEQTN